MNIPALRAPQSKLKPALRLVKTVDLPRDEWLDVRKTGIGSSDAAAAVGLNPYLSPLELWMIKTGRDAGLPKIDPNDEESPAYWGHILEPIVAAHYTKRTGNRVRKVNAVLQHPDPELPWMLANIDREVIAASDVQILECKTAGINGARLWKDGVPEYVQLQVHHQLAVTGKQAADIAVLLGGQHLEVHRIVRDEGLIRNLVRLEREFWHYVGTDTPPPADGSDSSDRALRCLYPQDAGNTIDYRDDRALSATFADLVALRERIVEQEKEEAKLKQRLQEAMGTASGALFGNRRGSLEEIEGQRGADVARLLKDHPELIERYSLTRSGSRRFLLA